MTFAGICGSESTAGNRSGDWLELQNQRYCATGAAMSARNIGTLVIDLTRRLTKHKRSSIVREAEDGLCSALNPLHSLQVAIHNTIEQLP